MTIPLMNICIYAVRGQRDSESRVWFWRIQNSSMDVFKLVAVGDNGCGKNVMIITYTRGEYPREYVPTVSIVYSRRQNS